MQSLRQAIEEAEKKKTAIGHFNVSDLAGLKGIFEAGQTLNLPIIIGVSEGEREFLGTRQIAAVVKSLREEYGFPIYINADHAHSFEKIKEAVDAGFDAVLFDGGKLPLEENIAQTKEAVMYVKSVAQNTIVEGELGYIGSGSVMLKEIPQGAAIKSEDFTKPDEARRFVKETGVDLLAPAVGNIHGMLEDRSEPYLDIARIREIREACGIPLVLHGGSGTADEDFLKAIEAGVSIIHISTELRLAWRKGLEQVLKNNPEEIVPYKLLNEACLKIKEAVEKRLKLFNKIAW